MSAAHLEQMFLAPRDVPKMNLLYMIGILPTVRGLFHFSYEPAPGTRCQRKPGFLAKERYPTRVWHVCWVSRSAPSAVPAYLLPCPPGPLVRGMLPREGQFMLVKSDPHGAFGAARYRHGGVEVCHARPEGADTARIGREMAWCAARLLGQAPLATTWIGVNHPRQGWQFHAQRWERLGSGMLNYHDLVTL